MGILCKIFNFVLNIFTMAVDFVAKTVKTLGNAVVDVLSELISSVAEGVSSIFSMNPLFWIAIVGGVGWLLLSNNDEDDTSYKANYIRNLNNR